MNKSGNSPREFNAVLSSELPSELSQYWRIYDDFQPLQHGEAELPIRVLRSHSRLILNSNPQRHVRPIESNFRFIPYWLLVAASGLNVNVESNLLFSSFILFI
jgi:hypothetical protein